MRKPRSSALRNATLPSIGSPLAIGVVLLAALLPDCKRGETGAAPGGGRADAAASSPGPDGNEAAAAARDPASGAGTIPDAAAGPSAGGPAPAGNTAQAEPAAGAGGVSAGGPEDVVHRYIHFGAAGGDLAAARELVDPLCLDTGVGRVDAVILLGSRMTVGEVRTTVLEASETTAKVEARVSGSVYAADTATKTEILGTEVHVQVGELNVRGMTQTTTLRLKKLDGAWRITCREAG